MPKRDEEKRVARRSDILIVDKDTGEPKHLKWVQKSGKPWRLVVSTPTKTLRKDYDKYSEAKLRSLDILENHPNFEVTIVSKRVGYGPPRSKVTDEALEQLNNRGMIWCPFCRKFRSFDWDPYLDAEKCPVCSIPIYSFHVVANNPVLEYK